MSLARFPAVLTLILVLTGCSSLAHLDPLEVTVADVSMTEATLFETTLLVDLRIANPNPEPLAISGASFKLQLDDRKIGRGMVSEAFTVPRLGTHVVQATFHVNNATLLMRLQSIAEQKDVSYGVSGKLFVETGVGTSGLKIQHAGSFSFGDEGAEAVIEDAAVE